ncbi:MAG: T9SS type A sorting domain-containing protein [Bacteroidetes bacterium]|nr:T9SS type A sorting domain-containing protein [Bacteroidota bacterium]
MQTSFDMPLVFVSRNHVTNGNVFFPSSGLLPGMGPHSRFSSPGGRLLVRESDGSVRTLVDSTMLFNGIRIIDVQQPCVNWDGFRILFAGIESRDSSWRIYEIKKDGTGFRKITHTDRFIDLSQFGPAAYRFVRYDDIDPVYTSDGKIVFASTRYPAVSQFGSALVTNLFITDTAGNNMFRITSDRNGAEKPTIDPATGRIVYSRWWLNIDMPSNVTASGLTRNISEALNTDIGNIWQANIINPDGDMIRFYSGDPRKRNTLFTYRPRISQTGEIYGVYIPHMPMVYTGGSPGIRYYPSGFSEYSHIAGVDTSTALYVTNPPSTGTCLPPYATDPLPLPDGRVLFSYANSVEQQDYGVYVCNKNGTGMQQVVDLPGTLELNAELLAPKPPPPVPAYLTDYDTNKLPPTSNPSTFLQGGFFRFDNLNIYANAPVDAPIDDAPPLTKNAKFRFFINFQRTSPDGLDLPILFREVTVNYDGKIGQQDIPANLSMFEQMTDSSGHVLVNSMGKTAHVTGMNFDKNGSGTKCVGCHAGHSLMIVPPNNTAAQFTNYSTSASVTQSSYRTENGISYYGKNTVDRKARNTDPGVNWIAAGGDNEYVELQWPIPIDIKEIILYNIYPNPQNGTNIQVNDCEIFLYEGSGETGHIASTGPLDINGKSVKVTPYVKADRMKVIVKSFTGTVNGMSSAGIAEIETISRVSAYQTGVRNEVTLLKSFSLKQNYPNPFNPSTTIKFSIPSDENGKRKSENGLVSLKVYDVSGREIAVLANGKIHAGEYEIKFDGGHLPSGVYFCRLSADTYSEVIKMILLK